MSETLIYTALRSFLLEFTDAGANYVLRSWPNQAPTPETDDFIFMTILNSSRQATNIHELNEAGDTETIIKPSRGRFQIDCYGSKAELWASTISTLLRDPRGTDFLEPLGVTILFADEEKNMTGVYLGDEQYVSRWMVEGELQHIFKVDLVVESFDHYNPEDTSLIEIDQTYKE